MASDRQALWEAVCARPEDDLPRLAFADWLEEHGDPHWAKYIRARCALDGKVPGDDYPTLFEQYLEGHAALWRRPDPDLPAPFSLSRDYGDEEQWWSDRNDGMERGLPSFVDVELGEFNDEAAAAARLIKGLRELVRTTPVRGVNFEWHFPEQMASILRSPAARQLRRISFASRPEDGQPDPVITALATSPVARKLTRLEVGEGIKSDVDARTLAGAPFERLRRLDVHWVGCSTKALVRLTSARWFRRLHRLLIGFGKERREPSVARLAGMPSLHTLALWIPSERDVLALGRAREFPAVRRLLIHAANLTGEYGAALGRARMPRLMELWLRNSSLKSEDLEGLAGTPLFDDLRVLTFDSTALNNTGLNAVAARPCAAKLRILRVRGGGFLSLAPTPLTRPGGFPALTTLKLHGPYARKVKKKDTAEFLKRLATPQLRHLMLIDCDFDDACAGAVATNPAFAGLTRLVIERGRVRPAAAEKLLRSENLRNLIELKVGRCPLGKAAGVLARGSVMPGLAECWFNECGVPDDLVKRLRSKRPVVSVS
jgi:uncharacterized protein (TIGR02996 family)